MKGMKLRGTLAALTITGLLAFAVSCAQAGAARVTVQCGQNLQGYHEGKEGILDRILNTLFTRVYAVTAPPEWNGAYDSLVLSVTGPDLDPIVATVPPGALSFTVELSPGEARLFSAIAYHGGVKKWGGHAVANLDAGEQSVSLRIFPIPTNLVNEALGYAYLNWDRVNGALGYYIYRAASPSGPFARVDSMSGDTPGWMDDSYLPEGNYYYRISAFYPSGEGEPTDPIEVVVMYL